MGGGQSKDDGIEGTESYWVHIDSLKALKGEGEVLPHDDTPFDAYLTVQWVTPNGKALRNARGTSAFERHTSFQPFSHENGAEFMEISQFNVIHTQLTHLKFGIHERVDGWKGMWDYSKPLASATLDKTLMDIVKNGMLGKKQYIDLVSPEYRIGVRLCFTVGDFDTPKPEVRSESMADLGSRNDDAVDMVEDRNGDGEVTLADLKKQDSLDPSTFSRTKFTRPQTANHAEFADDV